MKFRIFVILATITLCFVQEGNFFTVVDPCDQPPKLGESGKPLEPYEPLEPYKPLEPTEPYEPFELTELTNKSPTHIESIPGDEVTLFGLIPDLEFLRARWLKSQDGPRVGKIQIGRDSTEIVVKYAADVIPDKAWEDDFLSLERVYAIWDVDEIPIDRLLYKLGAFYVKRNPASLPEPISELSSIKLLPMNSSITETTPYYLIRYIDLETLANDIEKKIATFEAGVFEDGRKVTLSYDGANEFSWTYDRDRTQIFVPDVRVFEDIHITDCYCGCGAGHNHLFQSTEHNFIRYDRYRRMFFTEKDKELSGTNAVRSSVYKYVLNDKAQNTKRIRIIVDIN